jgi:hypothetical protein
MSKLEYSKCVFLGRGRDVQDCPGNEYFRHFVSSFREQYEGNSRNEKKHAINGVIRLLETDGYHFFKYKGNQTASRSLKTMQDKEDKWHETLLEDWETAPMEEVYGKVAHAFRYATGFEKLSKEAELAERRAAELQRAIDRAVENLPRNRKSAGGSNGKHLPRQQSERAPEQVASIADAHLAHLQTLHGSTEISRLLVKLSKRKT